MSDHTEDKNFPEATNKEIQEIIDRATSLAGKRENYHPEFHQYRFSQVQDELGGRIITPNGLKYPSEITQEDYHFLLGAVVTPEIND